MRNDNELIRKGVEIVKKLIAEESGDYGVVGDKLKKGVCYLADNADKAIAVAKKVAPGGLAQTALDVAGTVGVKGLKLAKSKLGGC